MNVSTASFIGVADLRDHLRRTGRQEDGFDERAAAAINAAAATLRAETGRILRSTTYRNPTTFAALVGEVLDPDTGIGTLTGEPNVFAAGGVVPDDPVVSPALTFEASVVGVTADAVTIFPAWDVAPETDDYTFGSEAMVLSGTGTDEILADEWPLTAVHSASWWSGTEWVAFDLAGARFGGRTLRLAYGVFPEGERNVRLEVTAGYREPRAGVRGDPVEWADLRRVSLRLAEMHFNEDAALRGRSRTLAGPGGAVATESMWPTDVATVLYSPRYRRFA